MRLEGESIMAKTKMGSTLDGRQSALQDSSGVGLQQESSNSLIIIILSSRMLLDRAQNTIYIHVIFMIGLGSVVEVIPGSVGQGP